jgi:hypothetical protein
MKAYQALLRVLLRLVIVLMLIAMSIFLVKYIYGEWGFR